MSFWHFKNVGAKNPSAGVLTSKACGAQLADGGEQTHSGRYKFLLFLLDFA